MASQQSSLEAGLLTCPVRGRLRTSQRAADGLTFTEEKRRIDAIRFLLARGYPKENVAVETTLLRFGNAGRNSFRVDFCVYDGPAAAISKLPLEDRLTHIRVAAEIKRNNTHAEEAKSTQALPALSFLPDLSAIAMYWDDLEQRVFYRVLKGSRTTVIDVPAATIPRWGQSLATRPLTYADLSPTKDLLNVFDKVENALHRYVTDKSKRYNTILQLLLAKVFDENRNRSRPDGPLDIQDLTASPLSDESLVAGFNDLLSKSLKHYQVYLPKKIDPTLAIKGPALRQVTKILAPVNILESRQDVMQAFYMRFAKNLYKWDLAQYFTPPEVIDFIVDMVNPTYGEHVKDPACGSADFLVSAFRRIKSGGPDAGQSVWGSDNSEQAVQISILNMLLNGDGKTNIKEEDSLDALGPDSRQYEVILCNPPFGTKIVERRAEVLSRYDLGHVWHRDARGEYRPTASLVASQQSGILFAELCVRIACPGGRIAIILPNGYLGNKSDTYVALRTWLLRHCRVVAVVGFPRFTFKKSGADVSASVLILEKRKTPLQRVEDDLKYGVFFAMIDSVGWRVGDKKSVPTYVRNDDDGSLILTEANEPQLDADFNRVRSELFCSSAAAEFPWLLAGRDDWSGPQTESIAIGEVLASNGLNLDAKRWCPKFRRVRKAIESRRHFKLGDVLTPVHGRGLRAVPSAVYRYTEIQDIGQGDFDWTELRGWRLPNRAKLLAQPGEIFIASVWGCAGKWFLTPDGTTDLVVTNGCQRFVVTPGMESLLPDLAAGLCSEAFAVQMRGLATGSDGLADVAEEDLLQIVLPRLSAAAQKEARPFVDGLYKGAAVFGKAMRAFANQAGVNVAPRRDHWALV